MKQLLHIFRKDLRRLWPLALLCMTMVGLHASHRWLLMNHLMNAQPKVIMGTELFAMLTPLFWWALLVFLIHQEPLCGDRQFWITRPYSRWSLLGAKLLFVAMAIQIPVMISDAFLLSQAGLPPSAWTLLLRNLYLSIVVLLPVAAFVMVTSGLGQVIAVSLACAAGMILWGTYRHTFGVGQWEGLEWMLLTSVALVLLAGGSTVLVLQYGFRKTYHSRAIVVGTALTLAVGVNLFPWSKAFSLQAAMTGGGPRPEIQITWNRNDDRSSPPWRTYERALDYVPLRLPVRIEGLSYSTKLISDGVRLLVDAPSGMHWEYGPTPNMSLSQIGDRFWLLLHLDNKVYQRLRSTPVRLTVALAATVFENHQTTTVPAGRVALVPGVGKCFMGELTRMDSLTVACLQPSWTTGRLEVFGRHGKAGPSSSPGELRSRGPYLSLPLVSSLNPVNSPAELVSKLGFSEAPDIVFTVQYPVAHIRRELRMDGVRMEEYRIR